MVMIFMIKHLIAIVILMAGTFVIGYWFGKNRNSIRILVKKYDNKQIIINIFFKINTLKKS